MLKEEDAPRMEFEFHVTLKRVRRPRAAELPPGDPRLHPLVHTLILAHRIDGIAREGKSYAQVGREWGLCRNRISQISRLLLLSPGIQEAILAATPERLATLTVPQLNAIAAIPDWDEQAMRWSEL